MAQAVRFRAASPPGNSPSDKGKELDSSELQERVVEGVFGSGFPRVLAGDETDPGEDDRDQEHRVSLVEDAIGDQPDHFLGLYRTSDSEDIDDFIEAFVDEVVYDASWFVIEPHDCTHDREEGGPCKIYDGDELQDKTVERGNVPDSFQIA